MKSLLILGVALLSCCRASPSSGDRPVVRGNAGVTYKGFFRNGIEVFQNIKYGEDTSGANRFKPPRPHIPKPGSPIEATSPGPACPQALGLWILPLALGNITAVSEDCLNLNVARPKGTKSGAKLSVMVWIHGGAFLTGSNTEPATDPDSLITESVQNGLPVIHVVMNYRLGFFGFAKSDALRSERSENAGLRDQRLAIEWVRDNIENFGGDPKRITIFGNSSGGLSVGMQMMAYGGNKPLPFQRGICQSQCLEPGITGNFTINAVKDMADFVGCNKTALHSPETIACFRRFDMQKLLNASLETHTPDIGHNIGDIWLPTVDGDFLPAAPSQLIAEGRLGKATTTVGWSEDDVTFFTDRNITTPTNSSNFISAYLPAMPIDVVNQLLSLYPVSDFTSRATINLTAEFFRTARVFRDILMTCQPIFFAEGMHKIGQDVYIYDWNQTILEPIIEKVTKLTGMGVIHTSEYPYIFGNLSAYDVFDFPFYPTQSDYQLVHRAARSWSTYATLGRFSSGRRTLQGWTDAFSAPQNTKLFVIGGPREGLSSFDGPGSSAEILKQRLRERCGFLNSPEIRQYLQY